MRTVTDFIETKLNRPELLVALDYDHIGQAMGHCVGLEPYVEGFKVGLQLYMGDGPAAVEYLVERGCKVFLDLKYHDIPNTVRGAARQAASLGVSMFNVHASGGIEMMMAAREGAGNAADRPKVLAVTLLTSLNFDKLDDMGLSPVEESWAEGELVAHMALVAKGAGMDGVVCSAQEAAAVREWVSDPDFMVVTPAIRPDWSVPADQARPTTPAQAKEAGATHLVLGRAVTDPPAEVGDSSEAMRRILEELQ